METLYGAMCQYKIYTCVNIHGGNFGIIFAEDLVLVAELMFPCSRSLKGGFHCGVCVTDSVSRVTEDLPPIIKGSSSAAAGHGGKVHSGLGCHGGRGGGVGH